MAVTKRFKLIPGEDLQSKGTADYAAGYKRETQAVNGFGVVIPDQLEIGYPIEALYAYSEFGFVTFKLPDARYGNQVTLTFVGRSDLGAVTLDWDDTGKSYTAPYSGFTDSLLAAEGEVLNVEANFVTTRTTKAPEAEEEKPKRKRRKKVEEDN